MDPVTRLFLIRHGEVAIPYHRVFGGRIDMELSELGHVQAERLAQYLRGHRIDRIYVSPMVRAQQTLHPIRKFHAKDPLTLPGLREVDFGVWTGLNWNQVREKHGASAFEWLHALEAERIPEAERVPDFRSRVAECVTRILQESHGHTAAVVCHGGVIRMILAILLDLPLPKTCHFEIDYASLSCVEVLETKREIKLLNLAPWRDLP